MSKINSEKLSHYAVVVIALTAVFISLWQGRLMQKHNELTVRPYFNFSKNWQDIDGRNYFTLELANQGYGPAIILEYTITVNGKKFNSWPEAFREVGMDNLVTQSSTYDPGDVWAANQKQYILSLNDFTPEMSKNMVLRIRFKSIYDEEFKAEMTL